MQQSDRIISFVLVMVKLSYNAESLAALTCIALYSYAVFFASPSSQTWLAFNIIVQGLGISYATYCFLRGKSGCLPESIVLLLCAVGIIVGHFMSYEEGKKLKTFANGSTVAVWSIILLRNSIKG